MSVPEDGEEERPEEHDHPLDDPSVEQMFQNEKVPRWTEQLTVRAVVVSLFLSIFFTIIILRQSLTTGIIPSFNISAGLIGFFLVKSWTKLVERFGISQKPFTRQENTVIQTCVVACTGLSFSGGFGSYLLAMTEKVADETRDLKKENNVKEMSPRWIIPFLFMVSFIGLFTVAPMAKTMIIRHRLTYPTGTAIAHLINGFHTPQGVILARQQVMLLFKSLTFSFIWAGFTWSFTGGPNCGFGHFPLFGLAAARKKFFFDFSLSNIGMGMICPPMVSFSMLAGGILSWVFLWPYIDGKEGDWYPESPVSDAVNGALGYKVFITIAMILGDGLFHMLDVLLRSLRDMHAKRRDKHFIVSLDSDSSPDLHTGNQDERLRTTLFLQDEIPLTFAIGGYLLCGTISVIGIPNIFPQLRPHHILVAYILAPIFGFCNAYGSGLTNWPLGATYGKFSIIIFAGWIGADHGGILAGLAACGVVMTVVSAASDLIQDFRTGYLTLSSPRSMFITQIIGTAMGCLVAPLVFWVVYRVNPVGSESSVYAAPYARVYRAMSILSAGGLSKLPKNCINLCLIFFFGSFAINAAREGAKWKRLGFYRYIPSPMGMAIPFYIGPYFTITMCMGSVLVFLWSRSDARRAALFTPAIASGLMCGESIWMLPAALLEFNSRKPPICVMFLSDEANQIFQEFLSSNPRG